MLPIRLGLVSQSNSVSLSDLTTAAAAIGVQIARDLSPIWNIRASISALPDPDSIPPGVWPIYVVDDTGVNGAAGLHLTDNQQPYALVDAGRTWTLTASHEALEMLVDPSGNRLVSSAAIAIQDGQIVDLPDAKFEYLVEVADPSEDQANAYMIDGVLVSDFYTPNFYDPVAASGVRYSFTGNIARPRQVLAGGYLSWSNPMLGHMQQLRMPAGEAPRIVDIPGKPAASNRTTLRGFVDQFAGMRRHLSNLAADAPQTLRQQSRSDWMAYASARHGNAFALARQSGGKPLEDPASAQAVLDANAASLKDAGATRAYVGWHFQNNWITNRRAIVVLAAPADVPTVRNRLPASYGDIPVEVRPDPRPQLPGPAGAQLFASAASGTVREELAVPSFAGEHVFAQTRSDEGFLLASRAKPTVDYTPPAGVSLDEQTFNVELTLHISPEQGWAQLQPFLAGTTTSLVVGMYEFTAPHIDTAVTTDLAQRGTVTMTMDSPPERPGKREQTVEQTESDLSGALTNRLSFAWALSGLGHEAIARAFPTAYHIKVAVRDSDTFWLSSGNWNTSNQPDVDPTDTDALTQAIARNDRDWHVICKCPELAKIFETYLLNDYKQANDAAAAPGTAALMAQMAAAPVAHAAPAAVDAALFAAATPKQFFAPATVSGNIRIKPLLTPDDYRKPILALIKSATQRFYMQTQYIHTVAPDRDSGDPTHMELIAAVAELVGKGVDVRLITSEFQTKPWIEKLQEANLDPANTLKIQQNVHNKGIIVDTRAVVVSSQNWSGEGTGLNRDAGLIIYSTEAAQYFEQIFLHDWTNLARASSLV